MKHLYTIMCCIISFNMGYAQQSIDALALLHKTDKGSQFHNYTPIYAFYFDAIRDKPLKFLEIGFQYGASARMWHDYFSEADLYFIDIDKQVYKHMSGLSARVHLDLVDQSNEQQLKKYIAKVGGDFDIIIDDGGHTMDQQIISFKVLFPYLKSGGVYVIEDLHTSYNKAYKGNSPITAVNFLKNLIDDVNYAGGKTFCADVEKAIKKLPMNEYQKNIFSMHFYSSMVFIFKR